MEHAQPGLYITCVIQSVFCACPFTLNFFINFSLEILFYLGFPNEGTMVVVDIID